MENQIHSRIVNPQSLPGEERSAFRPKLFDEYVGQDQIRERIDILVKAAKIRNEPVDHILFAGPPGLGKTTMAHIIANEMGVDLKISSGPVMERQGDLAAILTNLEDKDIFFIDEIHRMNRTVEEILYPAMEDFELDIIIGKGPSARSLRMDLPRFTIIGATTRLGMLSNPLRDRFGLVNQLTFYPPEQLAEIIKRAAKRLNISAERGGIEELAKRGRGTPRIALRLLKRARDFAVVKMDGTINKEAANLACDMLGVDEKGLDSLDRRVLGVITEIFNGGPVGLDSIAVALGEDTDTIFDVCEPYLIQLGFINRTPRGRVITRAALDHMGLKLEREDRLFP